MRGKRVRFVVGARGRTDRLKSTARCWGVLLCVALFHRTAAGAVSAEAGTPRRPASISAVDHPWDDGTRIDVAIGLSPDDVSSSPDRTIAQYRLERSGEYRGQFEPVGGAIVADEQARRDGVVNVTVEKCIEGKPYYFRAVAISRDGKVSAAVESADPTIATIQFFDGSRLWLGVLMSIVCGAILLFLALARRGWPVKVRRIAGLEVVEEAVGRATEMGRSCLFIPGIQDLNDIQTIAGLNILSRVSQLTAQYDAKVEVPTSRSLVMTAARETVQSACLSAGRPDAYSEDLIYYVTDEQFAYVAFLTGKMVRERPAACFYLGAFFAESLILAETGNSIGAIQIAGTAEPTQLPFFVAACDYTLIGEEFFAASAYLSGDPDQLGTLKGQDVGKVIVATFLLVGSAAATLAVVTPSPFAPFLNFLRGTVLK